jgi:glutaredoxin
MTDSNCAGLSALNVVLYTRRGCHLCDEALQTLARFGLAPTCIDIDGNSTLREKFDSCVPVVAINGRIRFRGAVHPVLLQRLLHHESTRNSADLTVPC